MVRPHAKQQPIGEPKKYGHAMIDVRSTSANSDPVRAFRTAEEGSVIRFALCHPQSFESEGLLSLRVKKVDHEDIPRLFEPGTLQTVTVLEGIADFYGAQDWVRATYYPLYRTAIVRPLQ